MGKRNKNGKRKRNPPYKKPQKRKYNIWIESCMESVPPKKGQLKGAITVIITRIELSDDHTHFPAPDASLVMTRLEDESQILQKGDILDKRKPQGNAQTVHEAISSSAVLAPKCLVLEDRAQSISNENSVGKKNDHTEKSNATADKNCMENNNSNGRQPDVEDVDGIFVETSDGIPELEKKDNSKECDVASTTQTLGQKREDLLSKGKSSNLNIETDLPSSTEAKKEDLRQPFITIVRDSSAKGKTKWAIQNPNRRDSGTFSSLPDGDCGDGVVNPYPKSDVADRYWAQRKRLFSRFDAGVQLDGESWYSVTPEAIANHIAARMVDIITKTRQKSASECGIDTIRDDSNEGVVILDAFCGCGGNAVAFGRLCGKSEKSLVVCVDKDRSKLRMAAHNAFIYDIPKEKIIFIEADATLVLEKCYVNGKLVVPSRKGENLQKYDVDKTEKYEVCEGYTIGGLDFLPSSIDGVFLSPPWGGPEYMKIRGKGYDLANNIKLLREGMHRTGVSDNSQITIESVIGCPDNTDLTINGEDLLIMASKAAKHKIVVYFLPKNTNGVSLGRSALKAGYNGRLEMEQNILNGKLKTITAYLV